MTLPALLLAAIVGSGALLGGAILWARRRQRQLNAAKQDAREMALREQVSRE